MEGQVNDQKGIFREYELLVTKVDRAFQKVTEEYGALVKCRARCSDCCHAVFGLFPIESVYLGYHCQSLDEKSKREALSRGDAFNEELLAIQERRREEGGDPEAISLALARERVRCPLLSDEQRCLVYNHRPITCRVYGVPTMIQGRSHVCGKSGFIKGQSFPAFNLDMVNRELYRLSGELLAAAGHSSPEDASTYLLSVSRSINMAPRDLVKL